ncbi:MAG TPA: ABC transporter substrate-binding protein [Solirubrobacterales bacterium]|nr:ABC transporter substrate-binding protein [Solirubrobacterales bacterium]
MISNRRQLEIRRRPLVLALVGLALTSALAGCGPDPDEPPREITISQPAGPYHLDPAYAYTGDGFEPVGASEAMSVAYTPLLTYRHAPDEAGAELIPGVAHDLPEVGDRGRTYRLEIRDELEYPNGIAVTASDFAHTVKRALLAGSPATRLLEGIEGVDAYLAGGDPTADIAGIAVDDRSGEIVIRLTEPDASFAHVLASWTLGVVPRSTRFVDRTADPPPGVGPYEITDSVPGERFTLDRSESFKALDLPDIPTGSVDRITVEVADGLAGEAEGVLDGSLDYMRDSPPPRIKSTLLSEEDEDRYREHVAAATYAFLLDPSAPPFDDPLVREAASLALDRQALARAFDGELEPGCALIPPAVPGYDEDLDGPECPYGDPGEPPDAAEARRIVDLAGAAGAEVEVWGIDEPGVAEATEAYAAMLAAIGLDAEPRLVARERLLRRLEAGDPPGEVAFLPLELDFPDPMNAFSQLVAGAPGATIGAVAVIDDPVLRTELERLNGEPDAAEVAEEWAALDRRLISPPLAYIAPIGHPKRTTFVSDRVDVDRIVFHPVFGNDLSTFALRPEEEP